MVLHGRIAIIFLPDHYVAVARQFDEIGVKLQLALLRGLLQESSDPVPFFHIMSFRLEFLVGLIRGNVDVDAGAGCRSRQPKNPTLRPGGTSVRMASTHRARCHVTRDHGAAAVRALADETLPASRHRLDG